MKKPVVAITVSTNYSDVLPYTLSHNQDFFDHWYIITSENDLCTQKVYEKLANINNTTLLFFDFQESFQNKDGDPMISYFNKGGAIKYGQQIAYENWPDACYLILDTDILIRSKQDIRTSSISLDCIYGPRSRLDYQSYSHYKQQNVFQEYFTTVPKIVGFFQLYHHKFFYNDSQKTDKCDTDFTDLWRPENQNFLSITVDHLGYHGPDTECTHKGRILGNGFRLG
jgi:hypothetical protein